MKLVETYNLAYQLMKEHGLLGWQFKFDRAKKRAGACWHLRKIITLSRYFVLNNSEVDVRDTVLHEIAHSLAGKKAGHGSIWKSICRRIGAKPERCYPEYVKMPQPHWQGQCPKCQRVIGRHRKPTGIYYHTSCGPDCQFIFKRIK